MVGVMDLNVGITNTIEAKMAHPLDAGLRLLARTADAGRSTTRTHYH
jgi:hypothetical protein